MTLDPFSPEVASQCVGMCGLGGGPIAELTSTSAWGLGTTSGPPPSRSPNANPPPFFPQSPLPLPLPHSHFSSGAWAKANIGPPESEQGKFQGPRGMKANHPRNPSIYDTSGRNICCSFLAAAILRYSQKKSALTLRLLFLVSKAETGAVPVGSEDGSGQSVATPQLDN